MERKVLAKRYNELLALKKQLDTELSSLKEEILQEFGDGKTVVDKYTINVVVRETIKVNDLEAVKNYFQGKGLNIDAYVEEKLNSNFNNFYKANNQVQQELGDAVQVDTNRSITVKEA